MSVTKLPLIRPTWEVPTHIRAVMTTRLGGVSQAPYGSLNLGYSTDDDPLSVAENEIRLLSELGLQACDVAWVKQVHGVNVVHAEDLSPAASGRSTPVEADAIVSHTVGRVCAIKVADCMPVLFAADDGSVVAAAHAGWRGLSGGVLEQTITACGVAPHRLHVWLGPCIGPQAFEVGAEVRAIFTAADVAAERYFVARDPVQHPDKYWCNLYGLARQRLYRAGVEQISADESRCTLSEPETFFSHRRDAVTGRMAALIWVTERS